MRIHRVCLSVVLAGSLGCNVQEQVPQSPQTPASTTTTRSANSFGVHFDHGPRLAVEPTLSDQRSDASRRIRIVNGIVSAPPRAPTDSVLAEGSTIQFGSRVSSKATQELIVRVTGAHTPGSTVHWQLFAEADGVGTDLKLACEEKQQPVGDDGSYRIKVYKPAVGSLDRCVAGWAARFVVRTRAGAILQDSTEWVPLGIGDPK